MICPGKARRETNKGSKRAERKKEYHQSLDPTFVLLCGWSRAGVNIESKRDEKRVKQPGLLPFVVNLVHGSFINYIFLHCSVHARTQEVSWVGAEHEFQGGAGSCLRTALSRLHRTLSFHHTFLFITLRMFETKCAYSWSSTITLFFESLSKDLVSGPSPLAQFYSHLSFLTHFFHVSNAVTSRFYFGQ